MKNRIILGAIAALLCFSSAAQAEDVFVRNKPFKQVVTVGSESYVPAESFLRALGFNWTVKGQNVTLSNEPSSNGDFPAGNVNLTYGKKSLTLEATRRGSASYISMTTLAKFLDYSVTRSAGITDVAKARMVNDNDKKVAADVSKDKADRQKAIDAAWAEKAAKIKEKKDKDKDKDDSDKDSDKDKDKKDKPKPDKVADKAPDKAADKDKKDEPKADAKDAGDKKDEPKAAPRLEVFRADARPDYSTGVIGIEAEVRNQGNGEAKSVVGTLTLYGPNAEGTGEVQYDRRTIRGPVLKPDGSWTYKGEYKHRDGASMPHGSMRVDVKFN